MTRVVRMILATALAILNATAWSQSYPSKTIRLITSEPGGAGDFSARIMAQGLSSVTMNTRQRRKAWRRFLDE